MATSNFNKEEEFVSKTDFAALNKLQEEERTRRMRERPDLTLKRYMKTVQDELLKKIPPVETTMSYRAWDAKDKLMSNVPTTVPNLSTIKETASNLVSNFGEKVTSVKDTVTSYVPSLSTVSETASNLMSSLGMPQQKLDDVGVMEEAERVRRMTTKSQLDPSVDQQKRQVEREFINKVTETTS